MRIAEVSKQFGISADTLRYYEDLIVKAEQKMAGRPE